MKNNKLRRWMRPQPRMDQRQPLWEDDWLDQESVPLTTALRFSPTAWAKLLYFRDKSPNEVGGFGITAPDDLLFIEELITVKQEVTCVSVKFDDEAVSLYLSTGNGTALERRNWGSQRLQEKAGVGPPWSG